MLESNQNHATIRKDGISTALPASAGEGGGYVPMIVDVVGCDTADRQTDRPESRSDADALHDASETDGQSERQVFGIDGYNGSVTGSVSSSLGVNCGMSTGRTAVCCGFKPRQSAKARDVGFEDEIAPTVETSNNAAVVITRKENKRDK